MVIWLFGYLVIWLFGCLVVWLFLLRALHLQWMAPESIGFRTFSAASDVWSFGVLVWECFTYCQALPFDGVDTKILLDELRNGRRLEQPPNCTPSFFQILQLCWLEEPILRPTFATLVNMTQKLETFEGQAVRDIGAELAS